MDQFPGDFSALLFKRSVKDDLDELSLTRQMLKVLCELDGDKDIATVNRVLNMDAQTLKEIITRLYNIQLIELSYNPTRVLDKEFFDFLKLQLSIAMGPIAEFLIEDQIHESGDSLSKMPYHRAVELVDRLSRQIQRQEKKIAFQQALLKKIKEITA